MQRATISLFISHLWFRIIFDQKQEVKACKEPLKLYNLFFLQIKEAANKAFKHAKDLSKLTCQSFENNLVWIKR